MNRFSYAGLEGLSYIRDVDFPRISRFIFEIDVNSRRKFGGGGVSGRTTVKRKERGTEFIQIMLFSQRAIIMVNGAKCKNKMSVNVNLNLNLE